MYTTIEIYATAADLHEESAGRRLRDVAYRIPAHSRGRKHFHLAAALPTLKRRDIDAGVPAKLARMAVNLDGEGLYIEPEALPLALDFAEWLPTADMRDRLRAARNAFTIAVANSRLCSPTIVQNLDPLRELFALCPPVMKWILTGGTPPDIDAMGPAFAVASNCATLNLFTENLEAA